MMLMGSRQPEPHSERAEPEGPAQSATHPKRRYAPSERTAVRSHRFAYSDSRGNLGDQRCPTFVDTTAGSDAASCASVPTAAAANLAA